MMSISPTASPQPLPGASKPGQPTPLPRAEDPQGWLGRDIATITYTWQDNGKTHTYSFAPDASLMGLEGGKIIPKGGRVTPRGPVFQPGGASFQDAVKAANKLSRQSYAIPYNDGSFARAFAVLQAQDGAWYTTALRDANTGVFGFLGEADSQRAAVSQVDVTPLTPALKAIVGMNTWVNFTDEDFVPTFVSDNTAVEA